MDAITIAWILNVPLIESLAGSFHPENGGESDRAGRANQVCIYTDRDFPLAGPNHWHI